jgi:ABC-2 type transport system permease protein
MKKDILYFLAQTRANLKNAQALASSFWIGVFSMIINNLAFFVIWYFFMNATGPINGWTSLDVFAMLGVSMFCFGFCQSFFYGIRDLPDFVMKGSFDSVLLAPVNSFLKLSSSSFSITAYGDLIMSSSVLVFYIIYTKMDLYLIVFFIIMILLGCITFICIRLLCSLVVFFIHDGEIVATQMFEIFLRPGLYPGAIFPNKLKIFFMTVIPALITSSVPIDAIKERSSYILFFSFIVTLIWVLITYFLYKISIKRYESGNLLR